MIWPYRKDGYKTRMYKADAEGKAMVVVHANSVENVRPKSSSEDGGYTAHL